jgi:hypothetical protein
LEVQRDKIQEQIHETEAKIRSTDNLVRLTQKNEKDAQR